LLRLFCLDGNMIFICQVFDILGDWQVHTSFVFSF
jgi:hypothetical protein